MLAKNLIQLSLFSTLWSAIIASQVLSINGIAWIAYGLYVAVVLRSVPSRSLELKLMTLIALMGMFIEACFLKNGLFSINQEYILVGLIPFWLILLWSVMPLFFHYALQSSVHTIKWIRLGAGAMIPLSYLLGDYIGLLTIPNKLLFYIPSALVWVGISQLLLTLRQYISAEGQ